MEEKFKLIEGLLDKEEEKRKQRDYRVYICWSKQMQKSLSEVNADDIRLQSTQEIISKAVLACVKYSNAITNIKDRVSKDMILEYIENKFNFGSSTMMLLSTLTPKSLMRTFPVKKYYKGKKFEMKDYFFTMNILSEYDMEQPIGEERIFDLLWDYDNSDLRDFCIDFMTILSKKHSIENEMSLIDEFFQENNMDVDTYYKEDDCLINTKTGKKVKITNTKGNKRLFSIVNND